MRKILLLHLAVFSCSTLAFLPTPALKKRVNFAATNSCLEATESSSSSSTTDDECNVGGWDRRQVLGSWLAAAALLQTMNSEVAAEESGSAGKKLIVMTGANSGVGYEAALRLAAQQHTLVLPCRTMDKSVGAIQSIQQQLPDANLIPAECDLASLASIQSFAKELPSLIGDTKQLDTVCYNAGLSRNVKAQDVARTKDGFELTVGTNHLGHFYLHHLLVPYLSSSANLVVTASGVHDPESPGGAQGSLATLGNLEGLERDGKNFEMVDGNAFDPDKAYKDSKLCNVMFTRELQRRLESDPSTKNMVVNCFSPGLIVGTGLFRDQNQFFTKVFDVAATDLLRVGETPSYGGGCLSYMATSVRTKGQYYNAPPGSVKYGDAAYGNQFTVEQVSKEAQDDAKAQRLWELSEQLVGIKS